MTCNGLDGTGLKLKLALKSVLANKNKNQELKYLLGSLFKTFNTFQLFFKFNKVFVKLLIKL